MTTANIGIKSGNAIVPYMAATKRTKTLNLASVITISGWTTRLANFEFYSDSAGVWKANFNLSFTKDSGTTTGGYVIVTPNMVFKTALYYGQALKANLVLNGVAFRAVADARANSGASSITIDLVTVTDTFDGITVSGDVYLDAEPTTYTIAANMEGVVAADVYIPPASATEDGIVNRSAQSFVGVKTHNTGIAAPTNPTTPIAASTQDGNVYSGTYTPAIVNVAGTTIGTIQTSQYLRVGKVVTVSGAVLVSFVANSDDSFTVSLPIARASNFAASGAGLSGTAAGVRGGGTYSNLSCKIIGKSGSILASVETTRATGLSADQHDVTFVFTYTLD